MLDNGERVGNGAGPPTDVVVDPIEGTTPTAKGGPNAMAVIAVADRGAGFDPGPCGSMDKIAVGPADADVIDLDASPWENLRAVTAPNRHSVRDLIAGPLERHRHVRPIEEICAAGARMRLIGDGDVCGPTCFAATGITRLRAPWRRAPRCEHHYHPLARDAFGVRHGSPRHQAPPT